MALKKLFRFKLLKRNKKMRVFYVGYKAAKYGFKTYRKRRQKVKKLQ